LRDAARETGFFYLTGHGIDPELQQEVQQLSRAFFALPLAAKQQVAMIHSPHFRGYNRPGAELTRGQPDWREQFDIGADRPALPRAAGDPPWWRLQGPNQWPEALPTLQPVLTRWRGQMTRMSRTLLGAFAEAVPTRIRAS